MDQINHYEYLGLGTSNLQQVSIKSKSHVSKMFRVKYVITYAESFASFHDDVNCETLNDQIYNL